MRSGNMESRSERANTRCGRGRRPSRPAARSSTLAAATLSCQAGWGIPMGGVEESEAKYSAMLTRFLHHSGERAPRMKATSCPWTRACSRSCAKAALHPSTGPAFKMCCAVRHAAAAAVVRSGEGVAEGSRIPMLNNSANAKEFGGDAGGGGGRGAQQRAQQQRGGRVGRGSGTLSEFP